MSPLSVGLVPSLYPSPHIPIWERRKSWGLGSYGFVVGDEVLRSSILLLYVLCFLLPRRMRNGRGGFLVMVVVVSGIVYKKLGNEFELSCTSGEWKVLLSVENSVPQSDPVL